MKDCENCPCDGFGSSCDIRHYEYTGNDDQGECGFFRQGLKGECYNEDFFLEFHRGTLTIKHTIKYNTERRSLRFVIWNI